MRKVLVFAMLATVAGANATVVDNFSTGSFVQTIVSGTFVLTQNGSMLSGERDVEMNVLANPFNQFLDVSINNGLNVVSNGFGVVSKVTLQYDVNGDEVGNTGAGKVLTQSGSGSPIGLGSDHSVRVNFLGSDLAVSVRATLRNSGAVTATTVGIKSAGGASALDLFLGSPMSAADSLTLEFAADPSGDFALSSIETVPEPASLLVVGLGTLAAIRRRRKA